VTLQNLLQSWRGRSSPDDAEAARQSGAIPFTVVDGKAVFLIITSRRTGRWIFPKGSVIEGMAPWESAAQEAFEEAGIEGDVDTVPIGSYRDMKSAGIRRVPIEVDLYPLRLLRQLDDWPEKRNRHRHWVILSEAKRLLSNPRMAELAALLDQRVTQSQPAMARTAQ